MKKNLIVKISDFGISKLLNDGQSLAKTFIGRDYDYAPEMLLKGHTSKPSDLYQFGNILFFAVTGQSTLSSQDGPVYEVIGSGLAMSRALALNSPLAGLITNLLSVEPSNRYQSCIETWNALKNL